jgi:hypothetical protein
VRAAEGARSAFDERSKHTPSAQEISAPRTVSRSSSVRAPPEPGRSSRPDRPPVNDSAPTSSRPAKVALHTRAQSGQADDVPQIAGRPRSRAREAQCGFGRRQPGDPVTARFMSVVEYRHAARRRSLQELMPSFGARFGIRHERLSDGLGGVAVGHSACLFGWSSCPASMSTVTEDLTRSDATKCQVATVSSTVCIRVRAAQEPRMMGPGLLYEGRGGKSVGRVDGGLSRHRELSLGLDPSRGPGADEEHHHGHHQGHEAEAEAEPHEGMRPVIAVR